MKREFYIQSDRSNKFWRIELVGNEYVIENGRVGTKGRTTRKGFDSEESAKRAFEKAIASKLKKGYVEGSKSDIPNYEKPDWSSMTMDDEVFWRIIGLLDWSKSGDDEGVLRPALNALKEMKESDIEEFEEILATKLHALDTREIAKGLYDGDDEHFSGDYFLYQRCVPVVNGKDYYESVLSGESTIPQDLDFEAILYLAEEAYEQKTGEEFGYTTKVSYETCSNDNGWQ